MTVSRALALPCLLAVLAVSACGPKTVAATPPPPPQVAAPAPPPTAPTPPAKEVTMVCRNSQTGASVECGTPNAVMVGVKDK